MVHDHEETDGLKCVAQWHCGCFQGSRALLRASVTAIGSLPATLYRWIGDGE